MNTPEQIAGNVLRHELPSGGILRDHVHPSAVDALGRAIADAVREAVRAETLACASLCRGSFDVYNIGYCLGRDIARRAEETES